MIAEEQAEIINALDKHGARLALHPYREAVLEVADAMRAFERRQIVDWLRNVECRMWSAEIADDIEAKEHLK